MKTFLIRTAGLAITAALAMAAPPPSTPTISTSGAALDHTQIVRSQLSATLTYNYSATYAVDDAGTWAGGSWITETTLLTISSYTSANASCSLTVALTRGTNNTLQYRDWSKTATSYSRGVEVVNGSATAGTPSNTGTVTYLKTYTTSDTDGSDAVSSSIKAVQTPTTQTDTAREWRYRTSAVGGGTYTYCGGSTGWTTTPPASAVVAGTPGAGTAQKSAASPVSLNVTIDVHAPTAIISLHGSPNTRAGTDRSMSLKIEGGSRNQNLSYTITLIPPTASNIVATGTDTFNDGNGGLPAGVASDKNITAGISIPCTAELGTYTYSASFVSTDIAGESWGTIDAAIGPSPANNPTFDVLSPISLNSTTVLVGQALSGDYIGYPGFGVTITTNKSGTKISTNPGAFHEGELLEVNAVSCQDAGLTYSFSDETPDLILKIPADFRFQKTGKNYAHVFAGVQAPNAVLDYHNPVFTDPQNKFGGIGSEVSSLVTETNPAICADLANYICLAINLKGLGTLPYNYKIFVRAKLLYFGNGSTPYLYTFRSSDATDAPLDSANSSFDTCASADGTLIPVGGSCVAP